MDTRRRETEAVSATFRNLEHARAAMTELERAGIDGGAMSLSGAADRALRAAPDVRQRDAGVARDWVKLSVFGGAAGMVLGALVGGVIGHLMFGAGERGFWITLLGMTLFGAAIGALVTPSATVPTTPQYDRTFQDDVAETVRLTVQSTNRDTQRKAAELLAKADGVVPERRPGIRERRRTSI